MSGTGYPLTLGCRVNEKEQARVDAAARLRRRTRAHYVKEAVLAAADRDLRAEIEEEASHDPR